MVIRSLVIIDASSVMTFAAYENVLRKFRKNSYYSDSCQHFALLVIRLNCRKGCITA